MQQLNNIKAVIFDWAGTLIDYGCMAPTRVFVEVFRNHGIDITMEDARGPMGMAKRDHIEILAKLPHVQEAWQQNHSRSLTATDVDTLYAELAPGLEQVVQNYCTPIPGVTDLFEILRGHGIKIGSTTGYVSGMMQNIIPTAKANGVAPDSIVTSSDVPQGRPSPLMCYQNAINLNAYPLCKMVKIGDTAADIREGLNAGMWTIGLAKCGNETGLSEEAIQNLSPDTVNQKVEEAKARLLTAGAHYVVDGPWECLPILEEINHQMQNNENPLSECRQSPN